jgi:biotin carboxylase
VPNTLAEVKAWSDLQRLATRAGIGTDLVLQSAFGDSGHTTFFIKSKADFDKHEHEIVGRGEMKIMKRINCRGSAIEACATKAGTIVGPLMTELVGFKELTPYRGGWCGNEILPKSFHPKILSKTREYTSRFGEQLRKEGYRGYFELDFLVDQDTKEVYLGELNPRITGASTPTMTRSPVATNHPEQVEWMQHAQATASVEREHFLLQQLIARRVDQNDFIGAFLKPPLFSLGYERGFGTLFTAAYWPRQGMLTYIWPGANWRFSLDAFEPSQRLVRYAPAA